MGIIVLTVVLAAACGTSDKKQSSPTPTTGVQSTELGTGVTADAIKIGVMMIDFDCVKQYVDELRPDQQQAFQIFIDEINAKGGINHRQLEPVFKTFCPINLASELAACTSLTEDHKIFAAIGIFYDPSGDAQLCFAKRHHTVIVANALTQGLVDKAPHGLMVTPDILPERRLNVIMSLLKSEGTLRGKKVGTISNAANRSRVTKVVVPGLRDLGVERGADAALTITTADTTEAQAQLDSFIERWKDERTNALIIVGEDVANKQFVEKIKKAIPDMLLVADTTSILDSAREEQKAHVSPNPYDGAISAEGQTGTEHTKTPHFAFCRDIWEKATGRKVPSPNAVVKLPNGKQDDIYAEVEDACLFTNMFATIATRVGPYLSNDNWVRTVNNFGPIDVNSTIYASIHDGKYDADDTYGLVAYDPTIPETGDWRAVTPVRDVSG